MVSALGGGWTPELFSLQSLHLFIPNLHFLSDWLLFFKSKLRTEELMHNLAQDRESLRLGCRDGECTERPIICIIITPHLSLPVLLHTYSVSLQLMVHDETTRNESACRSLSAGERLALLSGRNWETFHPLYGRLLLLVFFHVFLF